MKMAKNNLQIGQLLLENNLITQSQLDEALKVQHENRGRKLGDILVESGVISERQLMQTLEKRLNVPFVDLAETQIDPAAPALIGEELARRHHVIPIKISGRVLTVATDDPMNYYALDDVRLATNMEIRPVLCLRAEIDAAISRFYSSRSAEAAAADLSREYDAAAGVSPTDSVSERIDSAPVVRLVNSMIEQAVQSGASDIHIEPLDNSTRVRMRIDGILREQMTLSAAAHASIVTRLKIMGNMDIAERRLPQDGRVRATVDGREIDLRLSVLPTVTGEKVVIRILGGEGSVMSIDDLGLSERNMALFKEILARPSGMILVSGPTGSGKTTTLYSILGALNKPGVNIITVEDPVEYRMDGVNQVQVNPKAGLTFAGGLRSILRQDPDIIMVGEIRDDETAQIGVRASITGHLVLSSVHTNDSASTVSRLVNMHVEPYLISSAVSGIIAQRLVRRICPRCRVAAEPTDSEKHLLGLRDGEPVYRGTGCNYCSHTGYRGRIAVHEILVVDREMRSLIDDGRPVDDIRDAAALHGTVSLADTCLGLVRSGVTSVEEMLRVTYSN
jgi:type IV pilus assembly protein PilB